MNAREAEFYKNLEIDEVDKPRAVKALFAKGIEKHILVKNFLLTWRNENKIRCSEVASTYRYDKRIRNTLFKYISYLEEFYRGLILDAYQSKPSKQHWIKELKSYFNEQGKDLNAALEKFEFSRLIIQMLKMPQSIKQKCGLVKKDAGKNATAIIELRNAVMHNKFLLLFKGFDICYINGDKSAGLRANIINLANFLPNGVKEKCLADIDACKEERDNKGKIKWDLPEQVIVRVWSIADDLRG